VISVSAYYFLKNRHIDFAKASLKIGLVIALLSSLGQLASGHASAITVSEHQPAKLAALEGHYEEKAPGDLYLFGWVDEKNEKVLGLGLPGFLSFLVSNNFDEPLQGLRAFPEEDRPPVQLTFQSYHLMIGIGMALIGLSVLGVFLWGIKRLFVWRWVHWLFLISFLGPQIANQAGWMAAEVGRQPWIVYGLMRTADAVSKNVSAPEILTSLILFTIVYTLLFGLYLFLLIHKIKTGPEEA